MHSDVRDKITHRANPPKSIHHASAATAIMPIANHQSSRKLSSFRM